MALAVDGRRRPRPDLAERNRARATHGLSGSPTRKTWEAMIRRCCDPDNKDYCRYGERGIRVCDRWRDSFELFIADMGVRPKGLTIGRIDNDKDYEPGNCRWETVRQQSNNRRSSRLTTAYGRTQTISQWARELALIPGTLGYRLRAGWPIELALDPRTDRTRRRK